MFIKFFELINSFFERDFTQSFLESLGFLIKCIENTYDLSIEPSGYSFSIRTFPCSFVLPRIMCGFGQGTRGLLFYFARELSLFVPRLSSITQRN